ncbi:MAG: hypothetical protein ILP14_08735 [Oscillospiraceae bacterium]|nr:hypothetical protein [Oscillospiraceae bacterium]
MYSAEYERAKKEFVNCLVFGVIGFGVPFYNAFKEWLPIMKREKEKSLSEGQKEMK